jgi:hypothetical protein
VVATGVQLAIVFFFLNSVGLTNHVAVTLAVTAFNNWFEVGSQAASPETGRSSGLRQARDP